MFFNKEISEEVKKLIHKMMKNDPEKRLSARQCLTLPWFMNKS
jgi:serine/threonine protein kinase